MKEEGKKNEKQFKEGGRKLSVWIGLGERQQKSGGEMRQEEEGKGGEREKTGIGRKRRREHVENT